MALDDGWLAAYAGFRHIAGYLMSPANFSIPLSRYPVAAVILLE